MADNSNNTLKVGDTVKVIFGDNYIGVIIDAHPEIDAYVVEKTPNNYGWYRSHHIELVDKKQKSSECEHEFKVYHGFSETYHFCVKCDKKVTKAAF